jgi:hypothetical protein
MSERVTICADPKDGNDTAEVDTRLEMVPREGDVLTIAVPTGETALEVTLVELYSLADTPPRVWVEMDGYDLSELDEALASLRTGYALGIDDDTDAVRAAMRWGKD